MAKDGTLSGYLNKGVGNMVSKGQIKKSEGKERQSMSHHHLIEHSLTSF